MTRWVLQQRYCKTCGTPVEKNKHYCPKCKHERELAIDRERYRQGKKTPGGPHKTVERECEYCGKRLQARTSEVKRGNGRYCSMSCAGKANGAKAAARCRARRKVFSCAINWAECPVCGKQFIKRQRRKYCSSECSDRVYAGWHEAHYVSVRDRNELVTKRCKECGNEFSVNFYADKRVFCSDKCGKRYTKRNRKARLCAQYVEPVAFYEIAERDHWRCQLCGKLVARGECVPHPRAPVLDHIVPVACGGTHERANIQLAHFMCNSLKGDRAMGEQLRLLG